MSNTEKYLNILYTIKFFEQKYQKNFDAFEAEINSSKEEDYEKWDDYIEWKAFNKLLGTSSN